MFRRACVPLRGIALILTVTVGLTACTRGPEGLTQSTPPAAKPAPPPPAGPSQAEIRRARAERNRAANEAAAVAVATASASSRSQQDYYAQAESELLSRGRLRQARIPQDAPISAESLARDFIQIALRDEYSRSGERLVADSHPAPLRRWELPVRLQLEFGTSLDLGTRSIYRSEVAGFAARLQRVSGHPVALTASNGNFVVLVLNDDERRQIGPRLSELVPGIPADDISALRNLAPGNYCTVFAYSRGASASYVNAVALIRAELPPLLRSSCIHEELAQGMGLANDSPSARPSIFNDDEEFALLTRHDELLLKILYDPRLRPGMSEAEAAPIVRQIAAELLPDTT